MLAATTLALFAVLLGAVVLLAGHCIFLVILQWLYCSSFAERRS